MLASTDILAAARQTSPEDLQSHVKMFVTKLIDEFILKLRIYQVDRLTAACGGQDFVQHTQTLLPSKRLSANPEEWDLGTLVQVFHAHADTVFKHDFGGEVRQVIPVLMQIKEMRNRRAHNVSRSLPILAREAYSIADQTCRFFDLMTVEVPSSITATLKSLRREALQMLYVEELHAEHQESLSLQPSLVSSNHGAAGQALQQQPMQASKVSSDQVAMQQPSSVSHPQPSPTAMSGQPPQSTATYSGRVAVPRYNVVSSDQSLQHQSQTNAQSAAQLPSNPGNQAMGFAYTENEFEVVTKTTL